MPLYEYRCNTCGTLFDSFLPLDRYKEPQSCKCGGVGEKQLSAVRVIADYAGYECPVTGNWIEGRKAHEENLKRTGCRLLEPGEKETAEQYRKKADQDLEDKIAETAVQKVAQMPQKDIEALGALLESNDVSLTRTTV